MSPTDGPADLALFGDQGRRTERTEWGVDWPVDSYLNQRGKVAPAVDREHAERMAEYPYWHAGQTYHGFVVSRTVVTYTTEWEAM